MVNVEPGPATHEVYEAQQENRLRGKDLSEACGIYSFLVRYEHGAFKFNSVINDVRTTALGYHAVSVNIGVPTSTRNGYQTMVKAKDGLVLPRHLIGGPLRTLSFPSPESAYFYKEDREADLAPEELAWTGDDTAEALSLYEGHEEQKQQHWKPGDKVIPHPLLGIGPLLGLGFVVVPNLRRSQ